jgi:hypothetical protein
MAFFPQSEPPQVKKQKIYVGSIKTVIGHLEGTAGLASLLKASQAVKHGLIPPNLHFNQLNPDIDPFYRHLEVPTILKPWPNYNQGFREEQMLTVLDLEVCIQKILLEAKKTDLMQEPMSMPLSKAGTVTA